jgi:hypothetical protein
MKGRDLARIMRAKNKRDIRRATMTMEERRAIRARRRRMRLATQIFYFVGGFACTSLSSFSEILMFFWFGLLGPLLERCEMF